MIVHDINGVLKEFFIGGCIINVLHFEDKLLAEISAFVLLLLYQIHNHGREHKEIARLRQIAIRTMFVTLDA